MDKIQYKAYLSTLPQSYLVDLMISLQEQNEALSKAVNEYKATQAEMADMFEKNFLNHSGLNLCATQL